MNIAESIAEQFENDGQVFEDKDELTLDQECRAYTRPDYLYGHGTDIYKYVFSDRSVIIVAGDCWDFGYVNCWCMNGNGHEEDCSQ